MAIYSRDEVANEIEASMSLLSELKCEPEVSHAINIMFAKIEWLNRDNYRAKTGVEAARHLAMAISCVMEDWDAA